MEQNYDYYAFISYKREDEKWAKWLQGRLESYRLPSAICKQKPELQKEFSKVFKDTSDILPNPLEQEIKDNLGCSKFLIVVCSREATRSKWVGFEIEHFISLGRTDRVLLFIVDGEPYSNDPTTECIHPKIKELLPEMLGVNVNEKGRERALIQVIARMLEVRFDTLWQRQRRRILRNRAIRAFCALFIALLCASIWWLNQPFDMSLNIVETTPHNPNLPFKDGELEVIIGDDIIRRNVEKLGDIHKFSDIAAKYKDKDIVVKLNVYGYNLVDTLVRASQVVDINIARNQTYSKIKGVVKDNSRNLLEGVDITIEGVKAISDKNGYFEIIIPIEKQQTIYYNTLLEQKGKQITIQKIYPTNNNEDKINTLYF